MVTNDGTGNVYGVFSDEGILSGDFYSKESALAWAHDPKNGCVDEGVIDKFVYVEEVCHDHPENPRSSCEECGEDEEEEESEDEDEE